MENPLSIITDKLKSRERSVEHRMQNLSVTGLTPNGEHNFRLVSHSFPFGTAIKGETIVAASGNSQMTQKLKDEYGVNDSYPKQYLEVMEKNFNGVVEANWFKWRMMINMPEKSKIITENIWNFLSSRPRLLERSRGHNVFWNRVEHLPKSLQGQSKKVVAKALLTDRLQIIEKFPFPEWDLVNEPLKDQNTDLVFDPKENIDVFVQLFKEAKAKNPNIRLYVNEYDVLNGRRTDEYVQFIKTLLEKGAPVDGVGAQMHVRPGDLTPISTVKKSLSKLASLGIPIKITELTLTDESVGNEEERATYMDDLLTLFFETPSVKGIYLWGFDNKLNGLTKKGQHGALFDDNLNPNRVGQVFIDLVKRKWTTNKVVRSNHNGEVVLHGFPGTYSIENKANNISFEKEFR